MFFKGWGRKLSGYRAIFFAKIFNGKFILMEDGFIRSIGLGDYPSFSIVEDDIGIYYDANQSSKLEDICLNYKFIEDNDLLNTAKNAIDLIKRYQISKYNNSEDVKKNYFGDKKKNVLVIAQTKEDLSLKYGMLKDFDTNNIIDIAINENPESEIFVKVHPDVITGRKKSDIDLESLKGKCKIIDQHYNPISLLKQFSKVYTKTSQMGFEALIMGCDCVCFGVPFYSGWGLTDDRVKCPRRNRKLSLEEVFAASYILYSKYYNPYKKKKSDIIDTIRTIERFRDIEKKTKNKAYLFGFSIWKRKYMRPFLNQYDHNKINYINPLFSYSSILKLALKKGLDKNSDLYIWGAKEYQKLHEFSIKNNLKLSRVEDGFIRSFGLGSDLTRPYSLIFDDEGIYFDPRKSSKLERILNDYKFDPAIKEEARKLINIMIEKSISKYNKYDKTKKFEQTGSNLILVVGQVEDDASVQLGTSNMTNLSLLKRVRDENFNSKIIYRPHPDVICGNRKGFIEMEEIKKYSDYYSDDLSIVDLISKVNEVHTMTSLVGFEALIQNKIVVTYGLPFYAGWGLTKDKVECKRRKRKLTIEELVSGVLILYPRYINPRTKKYCSPELVIDEIKKEREILDKNFAKKFIMISRNFLIRKLVKLFG